VPQQFHRLEGSPAIRTSSGGISLAWRGRVVTLKLPLDLLTLKRVAAVLVGAVGFFTLGTIIFMIAWAQREQYQGVELGFLKYVLVQTHLATENVIAAWYSSMLLLSVAVAAAMAYAVTSPADTARTPRWLTKGWLVIAAVFALLSFDEIGSLHERVGMAVSLGGPGGWSWVKLLALPIAAIGAYMLAFAWTFVRPVPQAFRLFVAGVVLFLANPIVEQIEMSLIHGAGAEPATWTRFTHDALLVLEEGVLELFGTLCFLMAILFWLRVEVMDQPVFAAEVDPETLARPAGIAALVIAAGTPLAALAVNVLPDGDTGIAMNWFPAAAAFLLSVLTFSAREGLPAEDDGQRRLALVLSVLALVISAYFGAGIYGYTDWGPADAIRELLRTTLAVGFAVVCVVLSRNSRGGYIGALLVAAVLMSFAVNVTGPHAALMAGCAAVACATGVTVAFGHPAYSEPRISQRSGNAGRPSVV
jgi:hypothetical protein